MDGSSIGPAKIPGGWVNHHWAQLGYQVADSVTGFVYAFGGTCIILFIMNLIPGLSLRASEQAEVMGIDDAELGEFAVSLLFQTNINKLLEQEPNFLFSQYDYVEVTREVLSDDHVDGVSKFSNELEGLTSGTSSKAGM